MLAEIFMVCAESVARASQESLSVSGSRFIPFDRTVRLEFKDSKTNPQPEFGRRPRHTR
jgi:hypothetical protein